MQRILRLFGLFIVLSTVATVPALAVIKVPPGNRSAIQPEIPQGSVSRTQSTKGSFEEKYRKIRDLIKKDKELQTKIKIAAKQYGIDPIHIVGALVGEHTYNVDAFDRLQTYYVKAISYFNSDVKFAHGSESVTDFVARPEFSRARIPRIPMTCGRVGKLSGKETSRVERSMMSSGPMTVSGPYFSSPSMQANVWPGTDKPAYCTSCHGYGCENQRQEETLGKRANEVYKTIMEPDTTLFYMAAVLKVAIDAYRDIAGYDISNNPGLTATLYNLGDARNRAKEAKKQGQAAP